MKLFIKSMSTLLAVLMMLGAFTTLSVFGASAADEKTEEEEGEDGEI